jgi:hypothetical protein
MTTKTTWENLKPSDIIYIQKEIDPENWVGPFLVVNPQTREISGINIPIEVGMDLDPARDYVIAKYLTDPNKTSTEKVGDNLVPVPGWIVGQEHDPNPIVLKTFTHDMYLTAKEMQLKQSWTHDLQRKANAAVIKMWEESKAFLLKDGRELTHINFYSGGMMRAFGEKLDETLRESVTG